jgi:hypothetical protein
MINILHTSTLDSYTAAWVTKLQYPEAILHQITNISDLPNLHRGITYISGLTITNLELLKLLIYSQLRVIHYSCCPVTYPTMATAAKVCTVGKYKYFFDINKSHAGIAWDAHFGANPRPKLINLMEDATLQKFKYANSAYFIKGLSTLIPTIENWNYAFSTEGRKTLIQIGKESPYID